MAKSIILKFTKIGTNKGPFTLFDSKGNIISEDISKESLLDGVYVSVGNDEVFVTLQSKKDCSYSKKVPIKPYDPNLIKGRVKADVSTTCVWRHLTNPTLYNNFYGSINPYIIEYPFSYNNQDQIVQSVQDYTKVYKYLPNEESNSDDNRKVELNDVYFNKSVLYNGQQSSGILNLYPKPKNDLKDYMSYPKIKDDSKSIIFTKSDNFYQYNSFWNIVRDGSNPLFLKSCETMSIDKEVNQENMDYSKRSYKKGALRAKELKIRHILDNRSDINMVSQFIITPTQVSYK